jgi:hypothetical protein
VDGGGLINVYKMKAVAIGTSKRQQFYPGVHLAVNPLLAPFLVAAVRSSVTRHHSVMAGKHDHSVHPLLGYWLEIKADEPPAELYSIVRRPFYKDLTLPSLPSLPISAALRSRTYSLSAASVSVNLVPRRSSQN